MATSRLCYRRCYLKDRDPLALGNLASLSSKSEATREGCAEVRPLRDSAHEGAAPTPPLLYEVNADAAALGPENRRASKSPDRHIERSRPRLWDDMDSSGEALGIHVIFLRSGHRLGSQMPHPAQPPRRRRPVRAWGTTPKTRRRLDSTGPDPQWDPEIDTEVHHVSRAESADSSAARPSTGAACGGAPSGVGGRFESSRSPVQVESNALGRP